MWKESNKLQEIMKAILQEQQYQITLLDENEFSGYRYEIY